jgi:hypothetical protein
LRQLAVVGRQVLLRCALQAEHSGALRDRLVVALLINERVIGSGRHHACDDQA